ncbi:hypothetical protein HanXRQr2_Chr02g0072351 [Helianthus annuus]|uniref:Uncharacterized protein n=1 Tax=Helianthus annuus TaxID=4232 RepID=A0A251S5C0_HELAN|nr:hypothetical protein HanXRQr2_Chr02g0072351 [Helianthus annuus]KAJ0829619.1 hypothetical protein HanPSC8_Chr15g0645891 [Helianthus annuus]
MVIVMEVRWEWWWCGGVLMVVVGVERKRGGMDRCVKCLCVYNNIYNIKIFMH